MATPNYSYEKRQRELAKKRKQEEKRQKKTHQPEGDVAEPAPGASDAPREGQPGTPEPGR